MSDPLVDLSARAAFLTPHLARGAEHFRAGGAVQPNEEANLLQMSSDLLRDLLAYASTVSQERDGERAARNMDAEQLCHLMIKLEAAEKERDRQKAAVSINAEQACKLSDKLDAAQSELSALSTRAEQAEQTVWAQAARELHAGSAWVRTAGNIERQDAIDECARMLANLARQYEERAATHPQETP